LKQENEGRGKTGKKSGALFHFSKRRDFSGVFKIGEGVERDNRYGK